MPLQGGKYGASDNPDMITHDNRTPLDFSEGGIINESEEEEEEEEEGEKEDQTSHHQVFAISKIENE